MLTGLETHARRDSLFAGQTGAHNLAEILQYEYREKTRRASLRLRQPYFVPSFHESGYDYPAVCWFI